MQFLGPRAWGILKTSPQTSVSSTVKILYLLVASCPEAAKKIAGGNPINCPWPLLNDRFVELLSPRISGMNSTSPTEKLSPGQGCLNPSFPFPPKAAETIAGGIKLRPAAVFRPFCQLLGGNSQNRSHRQTLVPQSRFHSFTSFPAPKRPRKSPEKIRLIASGRS